MGNKLAYNASEASQGNSYFSFLKIFLFICFYYLFVKEFLLHRGEFAYFLFFAPIALVIFILVPACIRMEKFSKDLLYFSLIGIFYIVVDFMTNDYAGILEQLKFFLGIPAMYSLAMAARALPQNTHRYTAYFFLVTVVYALSMPVATISLFSDNFKLYLGSAHYWVKFLMFILILYIWRLESRGDLKFSLVCILVLGFLSLLIVFSGSRSGMLSLCNVLLSLFIYRWFRLNLGQFIVFFIFLSLSYTAPIILHGTTVNGILGSLLKMDRVDDLSSGRVWLYSYHIGLFIQYLPFGAPAELLEFRVGDVVDGAVAPAASESMFTFMLAREGLLGVVKLLIIIYIFIVRPYRRSNYPGFLCGSVLILLSSALSILNNSYSFFYFLFVWLFFCMEITEESRRKLFLERGKFQSERSVCLR